MKAIKKPFTSNFKRVITGFTLQAFILISTSSLGCAAINTENSASNILKADAIKTSSVITNYTKASKREVAAISNSMFSRNFNLSPSFIRPEIQRLLDKAIVKNINITATYVGYKTTKTMILSPDQRLPQDYNPAERIWYTQAVKNKNGIYTSETYQDVSTGNILLSMSKVVINSKGKDIIGVAGIDCDITKLCSTIKEVSLSDKVIVIAYAQNLKVVATNDSTINYDAPISSFFDISSVNKYSSLFEIKYKGIDCFAYQTKEPNTGWSILTFIPKP